MATLMSIYNDLRLLQRFCHGELTKSLSTVYCPYVNFGQCKHMDSTFTYVLSICKLLLFFCTVWSTVNAPVQLFCTVCPYVNCLLFFLHCLSIYKLFVVFFCTVCPYVNCCCCFFALSVHM